MEMRALWSKSDFEVFFSKSNLGFHFWTFIFVHFSKPNSLFGKKLYKQYILFLNLLKEKRYIIC
jgi:hypothetical protein